MELGRDPATITPAALMHFSIDTDADRALLILSPISAEPSRLDLFAKTVIPRLPLTPL
jgi:hypothetical protein